MDHIHCCFASAVIPDNSGIDINEGVHFYLLFTFIHIQYGNIFPEKM